MDVLPEEQIAFTLASQAAGLQDYWHPKTRSPILYSKPCASQMDAASLSRDRNEHVLMKLESEVDRISGRVYNCAGRQPQTGACRSCGELSA